MGDERKRTTLHNKLKTFLAQVNAHRTAPLTYTTARELMKRVEETWIKFEAVQETLESAAKDDAAYATQLAAATDVETTFSDVRGKLRSYIEILTPRPATSTGSGTGSSTAVIRLPTISLPTFEGKFSEWISFKDLFFAAVANNSELTDAQKLQYLKTSVKGEPANLIKSLTTTDANYTEALRILTTRYDNKREIVQSLICKVLEMKPVKSENARELQSLMDTTVECVRSLKVLGCPTDTWDDLLVVIIIKKLDADTRREWAMKQTGSSLPKISELEAFMECHIRGLLAAGSSATSSDRRTDRHVKVHHAEAEAGQCPNCSGAHFIHECKEFQAKNPTDRSAMVKRLRLCYNCLRRDHMIKACSSQRKCKKCGSKHHTLLHEDQAQRGHGNVSPHPREDKEEKTISSNHVHVGSKKIVMKVIADVLDQQGRRQPCRIFIDPGSEGDFITEACVSRLGLRRHGNKIQVKGVGDTEIGTTRGEVQTTLFSRANCNYELDVQLLIMKTLTGKLPSIKCHNGNWNHLVGIQLSDPNWYNPSTVDILLGVAYFEKIMLKERRRGTDDQPFAWDTIFGWAVGGRCPTRQAQSVTSFHITVDPLLQQLKQFWEVEEPPKARILTVEEKECEKSFQESHSRDNCGRFHVAVPFNKKLQTLGKSRDIAIKRLKQVEFRLRRNPQLMEQYYSFLKEYEDLGHMTEIKDVKEVEGVTNYLCHHFVRNESSTTTKLRVVFDGSVPTTTGVTLNDTMKVGATMQDDLIELLLRFRVYPVVIKGDITKMFRQFMLYPESANLHRIVWRSSPESEIKDYRLQTVTYGTACAPYLATRCLFQLGLDIATMYPLASQAFLKGTYVDDILFGQNTEEDVVKLYHELNQATQSAGLELRKWTSNSSAVMQNIPEELRDTNPLTFDDDQLVKTLGVQWHPLEDEFKFKSITFSSTSRLTKRIVLSEIAQIFDPLGLISCATVRGKLILQELWKITSSWDDAVSEAMRDRWTAVKNDFQFLNQLSIPRRITVNNAMRQELHSFGDSSELAFGAIVYLRSIMSDGTVVVRMVTSKTRVAPLKQVTLPRLELNAAVLAAELIISVKECLGIEAELCLWSDSTIVLKWILSSPRRWKTYVANRVATIQQLTKVELWRHVSGTENPADLASRGCTVEDLLKNKLWWYGPEWLSSPELPSFPESTVPEGDMEEKCAITHVNSAQLVEDAKLTRFSSFNKLKHCTAYYFRFLLFRVGKKNRIGSLTPDELNTALLFWLSKVQQLHFSEELKCLKKNGKVNHNSKLKSLFPFIDKTGLLRVSGRLNNAQMSESRKHQYIMPSSSHLTDLIVDYFHQLTFHGGFQLTWNTIQSEFWIVGGRDKVRHFVRKCVRCRRFRAKAAEQLMGELPASRVTPHRPFLHTGIDYAGPFNFKNPVGRVPKIYKGYLCLFVCFSTKAIHLEAVSAMTTEAFIATLRRFISRRGLCTHIYSDCGSNFVGADRELRKMLMDGTRARQVETVLGDKGISWNFNPPVAPHRGGLWESGVKSAKHHLRRVVGNVALTFEQFTTVICQIEAVLNSRPLYPRSSDAADMEPLTPGHFLVGGPLISLPDYSLLDVPANRLSQLQQQQQRVQHFWKRWSLEYLNTLQQRNKWMWERKNVKVGDMVLLVEDTSPGQWKMGRVVDIPVTTDGHVRVVKVKTMTGYTERVINKLVPLIHEV